MGTAATIELDERLVFDAHDRTACPAAGNSGWPGVGSCEARLIVALAASLCGA
jgi:hypothetical protein